MLAPQHARNLQPQGVGLKGLVIIVLDPMVKDRNTGFTFIELVVVISISLLSIGVSIAYYGYFNESRKFNDVIKRAEAALYLARSKSSAAEADPNICSDFRGF